MITKEEREFIRKKNEKENEPRKYEGPLKSELEFNVKWNIVHQNAAFFFNKQDPKGEVERNPDYHCLIDSTRDG